MKPGDKITLTDGRDEYTGIVTEVHQERETRLLHPEDVIPANIDLPPEFDRTPQWLCGPTTTTLHIKLNTAT